MVSSGVMLTTFGEECMAAAYDCRMLLGLIAVLVMADLWWGVRESRMKYNEAVADGRTADAEKWKVRRSRAGRRTMNKLVDYATYFLLGLFLGLGIFRQMGVSHTVVASIAVGFGGLFEILSVGGHILAVHHVEVPRITPKTFWRFIGKLLVNLVRQKSPKVGDALEDTLEETEKPSVTQEQIDEAMERLAETDKGK